MLRRFFACLALLTGLAAVGAPVNAGAVDTFAAQVGASRAAPAAPSAERAECQAQRGSMSAKRERTVDCPPRRPVIIYLPTVQYGPDRALE
ncbi:hypothetical protein J4558_00690 [Leptolyngbya sp. 15MV]|nr:hypothetical protein J4558_00690 [Leptolyngbya sp. 15MV]